MVKLVGVGKIEFEIEERETIGELLDQLFKRYPTASNQLRNPKTGGVYSYVNVWVNGRSIKHLQGVQTKLKEGDTVAIFLPSAGG